MTDGTTDTNARLGLAGCLGVEAVIRSEALALLLKTKPRSRIVYVSRAFSFLKTVNALDSDKNFRVTLSSAR